jgi:Tfp pilus assembly protein PilO
VDKLKQWVALTVVGCLAVLAAGWFLVVSPKRSDAADLRTQAEQQRSTNVGLTAKLATLKAQARDLPKQQAALATVAAKIPDNPALPALIRALSAAASDAGVELVSLAPAEPSPVAPAPGAATSPSSPKAAASAVGSSGSTSSTSANAVSGDAAAQAAGAALNGTLEQIPVAINVVGGYFQIEQFFDRLENLTRALKVSDFTMAPGLSPVKKVAPGDAPLAAGKSLSGVINATVYMASGRMLTAPVPVAGK